MAADTHFCTSLLTSSVHFDANLNQKLQIWIVHAIRTIATDFQSCSLFTLACLHFFSPFPFLKNSFLTTNLQMRNDLSGKVSTKTECSVAQRDQLKRQRHFSGQVFAGFPPPFLKNMTFRYCSFVVDAILIKTVSYATKTLKTLKTRLIFLAATSPIIIFYIRSKCHASNFRVYI